MILKIVGTAAAGIAALLVIWWLWFADPLTKTALLQPKGENTAPAFFSVPRQMDEATQKLTELGFRLYSVEKSDHCLFHPLGQTAKVHVFADDSWRQGTLCIVAKDDEVSEIYWLFQFGAP